MADATNLLTARIAALDGEPLFVDRHAAGWDPDVGHFIRTLQMVTSLGFVGDSRLLPSMSPSVADEVVAGCSLLDRLAAKAPGLVMGPFDRAHQYWVATGRPDHLPPRSHQLDHAHFVEATATRVGAGSGPVVEGGLHTCSGALRGFGMWWTLLHINRGSTLFPPPWHVWSVGITEGARVLEIASAMDWVEFVAAHATVRGDFVYPDWPRASERWDGVHITLRSIVATQGIWFPLGRRLVAAPYWDVESTLWLRWVVSAASHLVEQMDDNVT